MYALSIVAGLWLTAVGGTGLGPRIVTLPQGHWSGTGDPAIRFALYIGADGAVTGSIGDAAIRSGRAFVNKADIINSGRSLVHQDYRLSLDLTGPISASDDFSHRHFTLYLSLRAGRLAGYGMSEGPRDSQPTSGATTRATLHVTNVVLSRVEEDDLQLVSDRMQQQQ